MSEQPPVQASAGESGPAADDLQPQEAIAESRALSEREDGVIKAGEAPAADGAKAFAAALSPQEQQPISPDSERNAQSEREDGTNTGS